MIYILSLHDALPISGEDNLLRGGVNQRSHLLTRVFHGFLGGRGKRDRKSTRLNSSHDQISYAVFCLKKKIKSATSRQNTKDQVYAQNEMLASQQKES